MALGRCMADLLLQRGLLGYSHSFGLRRLRGSLAIQTKDKKHAAAVNLILARPCGHVDMVR